MDQAILNFNKQFLFEPIIENADKLGVHKHYVLGGMGGSHLAAGILKTYSPGIELYVHRDYGLPNYDEEFLKESLFIANSYSGNTEETIDFAEEAYSRGFSVAVITTGGKLLEFAKKNNLPYILIPDTGIQPRSALGYSLIAIATFLDQKGCIEEARSLVEIIKPEDFKKAGEDLAKSLSGKVPVIYSSLSNLNITYNWKIKFNETGKIPAFYNILPELNHNEMNGFDIVESTKKLGEPFHFIFLKDKDDHPRVQKRMDVVEKIYEEKGLPVTSLYIEGAGKLERIFTSLLLADWTAFYIALNNGQDPEKVPLIEEFKKRLNS